MSAPGIAMGRISIACPCGEAFEEDQLEPGVNYDVLCDFCDRMFNLSFVAYVSEVSS